jgi:hypothetical protein
LGKYSTACGAIPHQPPHTFPLIPIVLDEQLRPDIDEHEVSYFE